jgi:hypothetical protein
MKSFILVVLVCISLSASASIPRATTRTSTQQTKTQRNTPPKVVPLSLTPVVDCDGLVVYEAYRCRCPIKL